MVIDQALYLGGYRQDCPDLAAGLTRLREAGDLRDFLWLGLKEPSEEEFALVGQELDLHPLAVEDAVHGDQRVKMERYDQTVFAVLKTLRYVEESSDIETGEVMVFVGPHFVVTVRRGEAAPLSRVRTRLEATPDLISESGSYAVFHAVVDAIVDTYVDIDAEVQQDLTEIEEEVFGASDPAHSSTIYRLKREVIEFRRAADPLLRPIGWLKSEPGPLESEELRLQFRDVHDHLADVIDHVNSYDGLLTDILNAHLAQVGVQQNDDMRKISAWVAIAAVPTLLAGIFGMNFTYMPGLGERWGYPIALVVMVAVCLLLHRAFRRSGWL